MPNASGNSVLIAQILSYVIFFGLIIFFVVRRKKKKQKKVDAVQQYRIKSRKR